MKRRPRTLIGPLAGWELIRLARRGQATRARLMTLYLLVVTFVGFVLIWFGFHHDPVAVLLGTSNTKLSPKETADLGSGFALAMMLAQVLAVVVITPGYAAATISEEKDRQTLPLLLTTALTDREIVWGKAAGRVGFVVAGVLAALPVMAAVPLFGGADFASIGYGYAVVVGTAAACGAVGVGAAVHSADLRTALIRSYGITALMCVVVSPFWVLPAVWGATLNGPAWFVPYVYPAGQLVLAALVLADASRNLRRDVRPAGAVIAYPTLAPLPPAPVRPVRPAPGWGPDSDLPFAEEIADDGDLPRAVPVAPPRRPVERSWVPGLPEVDDDDPLLWKERHVTYRPPADADGAPRSSALAAVFGVLGMALVGFGLVALAVRSWPQTPGANPPDAGGQLLVGGGVLMLGAYLFPLAIGATGAVARERQRGTLDALLALPIDREDVVYAKARAAAERGWVWGAGGVLGVTLGFAADGGAALGLAGAAYAVGGCQMVAGLGLLLSVKAAGDLRAFRMVVPAVVAVAGMPVGIWNGMDWAKPRMTTSAVAAAGAVFSATGLVVYRRVIADLEAGVFARDTA